jgi:hypothetical protein
MLTPTCADAGVSNAGATIAEVERRAVARKTEIERMVMICLLTRT